MENSKLMKTVGYLVLGTFAAFNVVTLALLDRMFPKFGPEISGQYSIMASKGFFIAYHVWGIIIALICMYALWKNLRTLFMISLLLMMILMFYPYFSSSPADQAKAAKERKESLQRPTEGPVQPPRGDTIRMDTQPVE